MYDTTFPADSVEFCPHPGLQDVFVCGTYKLDQSPAQNASESEPEPIDPPPEPQDAAQKSQKRRGQCLVFRFEPTGTRNEDTQNQPQDEQEGKSEDGSIAFKNTQRIDLPAVLDMKWCHGSPDSTPTLGVADSEGNITLLEWNADEERLKEATSISCVPSSSSSETLCLSLDWSNRRYTGRTLGSLVVSLSNGSLCTCSPTETGEMEVAQSWQAHEYEPWIAAWDYWDGSVVFSGGDDLKLKAWDIRGDLSQPIFVNKRFDSGITTIQSNPHIEHLIAVGSYDATVRVFDTRSLAKPLTETDVGGGAWRVKWHPAPERKNDLLVACMHDGFKVVRFGEGDSALLGNGEILQRFDGHTSLAYGADWSYASSGRDETLIGSCSFYDQALHLWTG